MKRLITNIIIFGVAIFLLLTLGMLGLIYTLIDSVIFIKKYSFIKYWGNLIYSLNVGIDKLGNILLASFLNRFALKDNGQIYPFGSINHTISHVLAINETIGNLKSLGIFLVLLLEWLDPGHMEKSL